MRALVIVHDPGSLPGMVGERLEYHGFELDLLNLTKSLEDGHSDIHFPDPSQYELIVPMGAIWSVYDHDTIGSWVSRELDLIRQADAAGVPVLGICFGGQALATALGGDSVSADENQVGWYEVESTDPGLVSGPWMEWHNDQIIAPPDAEVVAKDHSCVQAFRIRKNLGTQFHPEVTVEHLEMWMSQGGTEEAAKYGIDVAAFIAETRVREVEARANTNRLVDWFLSDVAELVPAAPQDAEASS